MLRVLRETLDYFGSKKHSNRREHRGFAEVAEKTHSVPDLFIILTRDLHYGRFRTTMKMGRRGPKTSAEYRSVSDNVQLFNTTFDNFSRAMGGYGSTCSSLRGMSEMLHSVLNWIQSVPQRLISAAYGARFLYGMDALLLLRIACQLKPLELRRSGAVRGFRFSSQSGLRTSG